MTPTGAVDWASTSHVGAVVDHDGALVARYDFSHTADGLAAMLRRFAQHGVEAVAIERPDGPVVETLLEADFDVFVISSRQLKTRCRGGPPTRRRVTSRGGQSWSGWRGWSSC